MRFNQPIYLNKELMNYIENNEIARFFYSKYDIIDKRHNENKHFTRKLSSKPF